MENKRNNAKKDWIFNHALYKKVNKISEKWNIKNVENFYETLWIDNSIKLAIELFGNSKFKLVRCTFCKFLNCIIQISNKYSILQETNDVLL